MDFLHCGCWIPAPEPRWRVDESNRRYLPLLDVAVSATILARTSRTTLTQTMLNPSKSNPIDEVFYTFPLYDGATVVSFKCTIGGRTITGVVKEKQQARAEYDDAVGKGEAAGLFEQLPEASDVSTTRIGNVPPGGKVVVEIVYLGELKHDAEADGSRFTVPTKVAPRYGNTSMESARALEGRVDGKSGIRISVDVTMEEGSAVRSLQSPSHPIAVTIGRTSAMDDGDGDGEELDTRRASASLALKSAELDKDFVMIVAAKGIDTPSALLETHASIPNQRAVMATLVPKFALPNAHPEIVFVVDRSGSMDGKTETLKSAMTVFLKSLPVGVKFNVCSFGSTFDFLFKKSKSYDHSSLAEAERLVNEIDANYGGTEMLAPIQEVVKNRYKDMPLEVMVITDGEIWNQAELFDFINEAVEKGPVRFFSLGIGSGASSSLVEGIARAGGGFAQFVTEGEKMDRKVLRMLKGALIPQIKDYSLEVQYEDEKMEVDDDFEMVDSASASLGDVQTSESTSKKEPVSLFDPSAKENPSNPPAHRYDHLPAITVPKLLQAPHKIPGLYPFDRTSVYIILSEEASRLRPKLLILRGTCERGPLELKIPVEDVGRGETIHQLAAKKAVQELEEGRGWIVERKNEKGESLKSLHEGRWSDLIEREAVRLGVLFQVGGKWCSFVAVEANADGSKTVEREISVNDDALTPRNPFVRPKMLKLGMRAAPILCLSKVPRSPRCRSARATACSSVPNASFGGPPSQHAPPAPAFDFCQAQPGSVFQPASVGTMKEALDMPTLADSSFLMYDEASKAIGEPQPKTEEEKMYELISKQNFNGSWNWTPALLQLLGIGDDKSLQNAFSEELRQKLMTSSDEQALTVTISAIVFLEVRYGEQKEVWEMVVDKARGWVDKLVGTISKEDTKGVAKLFATAE